MPFCWSSQNPQKSKVISRSVEGFPNSFCCSSLKKVFYESQPWIRVAYGAFLCECLDSVARSFTKLVISVCLVHTVEIKFVSLESVAQLSNLAANGPVLESRLEIHLFGKTCRHFQSLPKILLIFPCDCSKNVKILGEVFQVFCEMAESPGHFFRGSFHLKSFYSNGRISVTYFHT